MAPYDYTETSGSDSLAHGKSGDLEDVSLCPPDAGRDLIQQQAWVSDHTINNASASINTLTRIHGISSNVDPTKLDLPTSSNSVGNQAVSNKTTTHEAAVCHVLPHVRTPSFGLDHPYPPYQIARDLPFHTLSTCRKIPSSSTTLTLLWRLIIALESISSVPYILLPPALLFVAALQPLIGRGVSLSISQHFEVEEQFHEHLHPEDIDELDRSIPEYRESMTGSQAVLCLGSIVTIVCLAKVDHHEPDNTGAAEYRRQFAVVQARLQADSILYFGRRLLYGGMDKYKPQPLRGYGTWEEWVAAGRSVE
ncbi:hypothetical protein AB5N19_06799 [Seiridium cardinale]